MARLRPLRCVMVALAALPGCGGQETKEAVSPDALPRAVAPATTPSGPCVLQARSWSDRPPLSLAVREHGHAAVEIYGGIRDAKLTLGKSTRLTLLAGPVALAGFAEPTWVEVHVTQPVSVGPTFVLSPWRDISRDIRRWPSGAGEDAQVSIEPPSGIEVVRQGRTNIPCSLLTLEARPFEAFAAVGDPGTAKRARLRAGRRVGLREKADGPIAAWVTLAAAPQAVRVFAQEGAASHVAFARGTVVVHGWVGADDLEAASATADPMAEGFVTVGSIADRFDAPLQKEERICPRDVMLHVMEPLGRTPQPLGRIPSGTRIGIVLWDHTLTTVFVSEAGIFPVGDGTLVVPTKELDGCKVP